MLRSITSWLAGRVSSKPVSPKNRLVAHLLELQANQTPSKGVGPSLPVLNTGKISDDYRVVVESGLSRIEVHFGAGGQFETRLFSDAFLPGHLSLSDGWSVLQRLGAARPRLSDGSLAPYYSSTAEARTRTQVQAVAESVEELLTAVLKRETDAPYSIALEPEPQVDNQALLEQMKTLAKKRDMESRRLVYQGVVNAWFFVPVTGDEQDPPLPVPWSEEESDVRWVAFSDREALVEFHGQGPALLVSGIRLVRAAHSRGIQALKLNPASRVGGELLAPELENIVAYLERIGVPML